MMSESTFAGKNKQGEMTVKKKSGTGVSLTKDCPTGLEKEFNADPSNTVRQNAVAETEVDKIVLNQAVAGSIDRNASNMLDDWQATDQKKPDAAGYCPPRGWWKTLGVRRREADRSLRRETRPEGDKSGTSPG
jgi:hypothetical protein